MAIKNISIAGSGNVATQLGVALQKAGLNILQVINPSGNGNLLAQKLDAQFTTRYDALDPKADLFLVAVRDDQVEAVFHQLANFQTIVAHTSGIKNVDDFNVKPSFPAVFYPFVSMRKEVEVDFSEVLFMIDAKRESDLADLQELAFRLTKNVKRATALERQSLHLAAVFANNFTNHCFAIAEKICQKNNLSFDELKPLIQQHIYHLMQRSPATLQTGPALRHDDSTIQTHLELLKNNSAYLSVYLQLTKSIQSFYA